MDAAKTTTRAHPRQLALSVLTTQERDFATRRRHTGHRLSLGRRCARRAAVRFALRRVRVSPSLSPLLCLIGS